MGSFVNSTIPFPTLPPLLLNRPNISSVLKSTAQRQDWLLWTDSLLIPMKPEGKLYTVYFYRASDCRSALLIFSIGETLGPVSSIAALQSIQRSMSMDTLTKLWVWNKIDYMENTKWPAVHSQFNSACHKNFQKAAKGFWVDLDLIC